MSSLTPEILLQAYAAGVFPMAEQRDDDQLFWVDPEFRGILPLEHFHLSRRLARVIKSNRFTVRINSAFEEVIGLCREAAPDRPESWINDEIVALCVQLHHCGHAHSVECWRDGKLVGGLYGVSLGGAFFGESMFSRETDASKVALVHLIARLRTGDFCLLDTQFTTEHLSQFGVLEVPRHEYQKLLADAIAKNADFSRMPSPSDGQGVLQAIAQTS